MRRVIVGTAGHIDHGKTRLVQALTGIDCDRWREEKERGITIDIGFAHLAEGDLQVGFVDVPGHHRFLHNALAGLGGIRVLLLVVAADEGVKPQTREHLAIASLLGVPACLVALTKIDLVSPDLVELARLEVEELLADGPLAASPVFGVSSVTGEGLPELTAALLETAARHALPEDDGLAARLPIDRAFHLKGLGVVVTGSLASGQVRPGDRLELLPGGGEVRVRSVQVHGESRELAAAGERTALQLTGAERGALERGVELAAPGSLGESRSLLVRLRLLPEAPEALTGWQPTRLHLFASEVLGRMRPLAGPLEPGGEGPVEIRLRGPVAATRGDRVIVRRPSPAATVGGGTVLDPDWHRPRGRVLPRALEALAANAEEAVRWWVEAAGEGGTTTSELSRRLGRPATATEAVLSALASDQRVLAVPDPRRGEPRWVSPGTYRRVHGRARRVLAAYFEENRLAPGMPKAEAVARVLPGRGAELADTYLSWLQAQDVLVVDGQRVNLPGRSARLDDTESALARAALAAYEAAGLTPPSPAEVADRLRAKPQLFDGVVRFLVQQGRLIQLPGGLIVSARAIDGMRLDLAGAGWETFTVGQFKDRFGLSRKWAIPLLEHLDSTGVTRRLGDARMIVRRRED